MRWSEYPSRRLGVLYGACIVLVGPGAVAFATAASNASELVTVGAGSIEALAPTVHPPVPRDLSLLWLAPTNENQGAGSAGTVTPFASAEAAAGKSTSAKPAPTRRPAGRPATK